MSAKYLQEVKGRTVRLVLDLPDDYPTAWAAISAIAVKSGHPRDGALVGASD